MKIFIHGSCFDILDSISGRELYEVIHRHTGIPINLLFLMYNGKSVDFHQSLKHQGFHIEATVFVAVKGVGGGGTDYGSCSKTTEVIGKHYKFFYFLHA